MKKSHSYINSSPAPFFNPEASWENNKLQNGKRAICLVAIICLSTISACKKNSEDNPPLGDEPPVEFTKVEHSDGGTLTQRCAYLAAAAIKGKIVFAGGLTEAGGASKSVYFYDIATNTWDNYSQIARLSQERSHLAAAGLGNTICVGGGAREAAYSNVVDIFDASVNRWNTAELSEARNALAAAAAGTKIIFAGGYGNTANSKTADIYDISSKSWITSEISEARYFLTGTASENKIFFAGGQRRLYVNGALTTEYSSTVDIYDIASNSWSVSHLSEPRTALASAVAGNKVFFAGGYSSGRTPSATVDIYDIKTGKWSKTQLSEAREGLAGAAVGNIVMFAGGYKNGATYSKVVDVYDTISDTWSTRQLSEGRDYLSGAGSGNKIIFAGGSMSKSFIISDLSNKIDIFTLSSN